MNVRDAIEFLWSLEVGDAVAVTVDGRTYRMTVSQSARLADGVFGSRESTRVTVSLGPGRWSTEIIADHLASGRQSAERVALSA